MHSAIASDSRGFLREPRARRLPLAAVESSVVSPRLSSLLLVVVVVVVFFVGGGGDAEETAGVPVKGKPERRTFDKELQTDGTARSDLIRRSFLVG